MIKRSFGDDGVNSIINNLNESVVKAQENDDQLKECTCAVCGATFEPSSEVTADNVICPQCGAVVPQDSVLTNTDVVDPKVVNGLEDIADDYAEAINNENYKLANKIAKESDAKVVTESMRDGSNAIVLEKMVKAIRDGKVVRVKVRTKKKRISAAQKSALRKARKKSHTASADRSRKKSMRIHRKKLGESINVPSILSRNISIMTESLGRTPSPKAISKLTEKINHIKEALETDEGAYIADTISNEFKNNGFEVVDYDIQHQGLGFIITFVIMDDEDQDLSLGQLADDIEMTLGNYDVAYSDPTEDEDYEDCVDAQFTVVPSDTTAYESCKRKNESDDENADNESDDNDELDKFDDNTESDNATDDSDDTENKPKCKKNESVQFSIGDPDDEDAIASIAGGQDNIICQIDPQFLKIGQVIYDADEKAAIMVLSAPEKTDDGYKFSAEVIKAQDQDLVVLPRGSMITITPESSYYLLRRAPLA